MPHLMCKEAARLPGIVLLQPIVSKAEVYGMFLFFSNRLTHNCGFWLCSQPSFTDIKLRLKISSNVIKLVSSDLTFWMFIFVCLYCAPLVFWKRSYFLRAANEIQIPVADNRVLRVKACYGNQFHCSHSLKTYDVSIMLLETL